MSWSDVAVRGATPELDDSLGASAPGEELGREKGRCGYRTFGDVLRDEVRCLGDGSPNLGKRETSS